MKKNLSLLSKLFFVFFAFVAFSSCGEDKYYYSDPSANWDVSNYIVEGRDWTWDPASETYFREFNYKELNTGVNHFNYNYGAIWGYAYFGTQGENEIQVPLPTPTEGINGMNFSFETSLDLDRSITFYFHWDDYRREQPNFDKYFKIVILYPDDNILN